VQDELVKLAATLPYWNFSSKIIYRAADVGDYDAVDKAIQSSIDELGQIDILINNVRYKN
jgi:3-hydroxy acid dehydrogenase / malonic semialdehyde reductase